MAAGSGGRKLRSECEAVDLAMGQGYCISHRPTAAKRHHDHGNSYKGKHLIEAGLEFQRVSPLSSWQESWQHTGRHGAGEIAESSTSEFIGSRNKETLG